MSIKIGTKEATSVRYNSKTVNQIKLDGAYVWCRPFTYTQPARADLPSHVKSLTCTCYSTKEPSNTPGVKLNTHPIYYGDELYWEATADDGYTVNVIYTSTNRYTVTSDVEGVSTSGVSVSVNQYTVTAGTATYCKAVYLSTNASATSGSGTAFNYGETVYMFVTLNDNTAQYTYTAPSGWTLVSGRTYRVASLVVSTSGNTFSNVSATRTVNNYTVTFSVTSGKYGSWSPTSIANVPYNTAVTRSGNTVTVGSIGTATFTKPSTTVQYNYADPEYGTITSPLTGNMTVSGGCTRSNRTYTVRWLNGDGSVIETDNSVAYGTVLTYNSTTTPTKASTAQYSYTFNGWKIGDTAVTSGTTTNPGSTSTTTIDVTPQFTATTRTYTVTFSASNGSWSRSSITGVAYGTTITRSGATVTVTGYNTSTYTKASTTVSQTAGDASYTVPASVTGNTTVSASTAMTERLYTIKWIGADGSTALETDNSVAYNATLTYNSATPTKTKTDQYTYTFSAWKLGSTSGSTVTSGTTKNAGSTSSTTINIYATFSSTVNPYDITIIKNTGINKIYYKVNGASSFTEWTSGTVSANYGTTVYWYATATTGYTGDDIGSSSSPKSFTMGTSATISPTATLNSYTITFSKGGKEVGSWGSATKTAYYGDVISRSGNTITCKQGSSSTDRWTNTFTLGDAYSVSYNSITSPVTGAQTITATTGVKSYTLTFSVTNGGYGSYSVTRTPHSEYGAPTAETWSAIANGGTKTIYYGDTLTTSHSANADTATSWNSWPTVTAPTVTSNGAATSGNITVTNKDSATCTLYYQTASSGYTGTSLGSTASNASQTKTGLSFGTTYYCYATKSITRTGSHTHYTDNSTYSGTASVSAAVTATFSFASSSVADSESKTGYSSLTPHTVEAQTTYTITFTRKYQPANGIQSLGTATADTSIGVASVTVAHGGSYSETFSKTNYVSQTKSGSNVTADATVEVTLVPVTYSLSWSGSNWSGGWYTNNSYTGSTISWMYHGYTAYFRATPNSRYGATHSSTWYYNGKYYTTSATSAAGSVSLTAASAITYTVSASLTNAAVTIGTSTSSYSSTLSKTYAELYTSNPSIYYKITPNSHYGMTYSSTWYYNGNPLSGSSYKINGNAFTFSDQYKTATYALSTSTYPVAAITYSVSGGSSTNGTVSWTNGTYGANTTWTITANTGYTRPSAYTGTKTINDTNFTISDANKTAVYKGSAFDACTINSYTITWKYLSAYPDTWTTATETYNYGDTPSRANASTVTSGNERKVFKSWSTLDPVTANRTITATYTLQYNVTALNGDGCYASISTGWHNAGTSFTWTCNTNYAFNSAGTTTTASDSVSAGGSYSKTADYVNVTSVSANYATAYTTNSYSGTTFTSGWHARTEKLYWKITTDGWCFNQSNNATTCYINAVAGANSVATYAKRWKYYTGTLPTGFTACTCYRTSSPKQGAGTGIVANNSYIYHGDTLYWTYSLDTPYQIVCNSYYDTNHTLTVTTGDLYGVTATNLACKVKEYTLTINTNGGGFGSYSVSRTSSPYKNAGTGALSNGATIYYGDVLSGSATGTTTYSNWSPATTQLTVPAVQLKTDEALTPTICVVAQNSAVANLYCRINYGGGNYGDWRHISDSWGTGNTYYYEDTGLAWYTTYQYHVATNQYRTRYEWSINNDSYTGTNGVSSNVTATFKSSATTYSESQWVGDNPATIDIYTGGPHAYTLTISASNTSYGWYNVIRTSSPAAGASTGSGLSNGATIYYGDVLTGNSGGINSWTDWGNWGTVAAPTCTSKSGSVITLRNNDSVSCTLYYSTSNTTGGTSLGAVNSGSTVKALGLSGNTTYYFSAARTVWRYGTRYTYYGVSGNYAGTNYVTGNVTASFNFGYSTDAVSESTTGWSSVGSVTTYYASRSISYVRGGYGSQSGGYATNYSPSDSGPTVNLGTFSYNPGSGYKVSLELSANVSGVGFSGIETVYVGSGSWSPKMYIPNGCNSNITVTWTITRTTYTPPTPTSTT